MDETESPSKSNSSSRNWFTCLAVLVLLAITLPLGVFYLRQHTLLQMERRRAEWRQKCFDGVKNGDTQAMVMDSGLLPMLAADSECVANLDSLYFSGVSIAPTDAKNVARLTNVKDIGFYDTSGADVVLKHADGLPIQSLFFEVSPVSHDSLRALSEFPKLKKVHFEQGMSAEQIAIMRELRSDIVVEISYPLENEPAGGNRGEQTGERESESAG